ncbi:putative diphthamide synthesis protein-domain-containing protein [Hygrophoropsis aurantiaca]|uniref:Diphthamide synthesis protein-domain-containing protein n=1 Tax=Hygrophoropsis aurantiaca TaxID=72124 RepID=A0ACB8ANQ9_9AGAM|nr:putative diphthamide synthesis protein-domain-containing protein [Hygrophoropsis aurantiaca]
MSTVSAFSASGEEAIARTIDIGEISVASTSGHDGSDFPTFYEIERTAAVITNGKFERVALQFPDELLHDSVPVYRALRTIVGDESRCGLYVLADTSYGSCCVDEVAAQHVDADLVVHYGHACMSQTSRLPVVYVFGRKPIDVDACVEKFAGVIHSSSSARAPENEFGATKLGRQYLLLRHNVGYAYRADEVATRLRAELGSEVSVLHNPIPLRTDPASPPGPAKSNEEPPGSVAPINDLPVSEPETSTRASASIAVPEEECTILYIGGESLGLTNLLMTHTSSEIYSYDPSTDAVRQESGRTNKLLMRRYATVQKARDADVFGILVGTLGVASYLPLITHLRNLLKRARKKSYTVSVGKLNPAKLANFMEVECFVLVACPENSVVEAKEFFRPIITPFELEIALQGEGAWSGQYILDFEKLIAAHGEGESIRNTDATGDESEEDPDRPTFSLVTGKYRHAKRYGDGGEPQEQEGGSDPSAVILRNQDGTVSRLADSAAAMFLQSRTYQGLETRIGEDAPSILEQGRSGIARGYADDHTP